MTVTKSIALLLVCLSLLVSNVASAAMPCCATDNAQPIADAAMDMPCHDMANTDSSNMMNCDSCDCQNCIKMSALLPHQTMKEIVASSISLFAPQNIHIHHPQDIFQPPKQRT